MTPTEREELERLRRHLREDATEPNPPSWYPWKVKRLIELERKEAAVKCPVCEIERNTEDMLAAGTLPVLDMVKWSREHAEQRAQQKWNAQADQRNQWSTLGQDEKDALIVAEMAVCSAP